MVLTNFRNEFVFRHGLCRMVDCETLCLESLDGLLADIFEKEELQAFIVYGMKNLG